MAGLLSRFDHRQTNAVLDRAARIQKFDFRDDGRARRGAEPRQPHQRRVADRVQDGRENLLGHAVELEHTAKL